MRSIILIVLVVLCHNALGERTSFQQGEFRNDDTEIDYNEHDFASSEQGEFGRFQQTGGKPFYLTSQGNDESEIEFDEGERAVPRNVQYRMLQRFLGKPGKNHPEIDAAEEETQIESHQHEYQQSHHHDFSEDFSHDVNTDKADCNCKKGKPRITYGPEQIVKGRPETYIHHQPKIIVRQPPTHVRIEHPPTIIHPSSIVFRRHGKTIRRPVVYQHLPRDIQERPVYIKVIRPIEKKVLIGEREDKLPCDKVAKEFRGQHGDEVFDSYSGESFGESFQQKESSTAGLNIKEKSQISK